MAISKEKKQSQVADLEEQFAKSRMTVLTDYKGLTVAELQELRRQLKTDGGNYKIVKNTLISIAAKNTFKDIDTSLLDGPVALAFGYEDEVAPAQIVAKFAKSAESLEILGGITAEGAILSADEVKRLATLPSKEVLRAQVVGTIAAPLSGFVNVMSGNIRGVINALNAITAK